MKQLEIQFFWSLTEQIPLDLDYTGCAKQISIPFSTDVTSVAFINPTWTTNIAPQLSVEPINSVGQLSIGGIKVGLEAEPKWYQKLFFKLLGFDWNKKA